ncbi:MAG TPA: DNA gyrase/topoisomerase IV subunit A [Bacteroidia bacterium]|jgi:topoisomerase-4 subunit A|nr:DNA gyrase/topoisomerase IV subunit A [Bacteroidia bacterium]
MAKKKDKDNSELFNGQETPGEQHDQAGQHMERSDIKAIGGMYENWFLDYASYVILERAVPYVEDGLKPVQRRILHSMWEMEDGRYNKVANIIGNTMKYHPHGDASIGDALVQVGQKDLLIDMQGNWGNIFTGDSAAASRYIEARLSKFALDVVFNPKTTIWQASYDGRNREPVTLPMKFPLLLAQGVEGIAVGLACKILPHNFCELIDASIAALRGRKVDLYPDFPTGGSADCSNYNEGLRGGKIRVRAKIKVQDGKTLVVTEIPFGTTTGSLIDSVIAANEKGKIKIRKIEDNTAENVEVMIHLQPGASTDKTIDALYAFTDCEVSISPNACIIENEKPRFVGVNEMLKISAHRTMDLLKRELEIELSELQERWHFSSLEKIFIKEEMYIDFKKYADRETLYGYLYEQFKPHRKKLLRAITDEDLNKLTQIPMIRITRFDSIKADEFMKDLDHKIEGVKKSLAHLVDYAIDYFKELKNKYGKGRERKTDIRTFEQIEVRHVAINNVKLYANKEEGFIGYGMKKDEFIFDCSDLDEIVIFRRDGVMMVTKIAEKTYVGKDIIHIGIFKRGEDKAVYNLAYRDGLRGNTMIKRFTIGGVTRDKEYNLTRGAKDSKVHYFSVSPNGENEIITVSLTPTSGARKQEFDMDLSQVAIKGRDTQGNILTRYPVRKIVLKEKGKVAIKKQKVWFDDDTHRLNYEERGTYIGNFGPEDKILTITQSGHYRMTGFETSLHFDEDTIRIEKYDPSAITTCIYLDGESKTYFVKRFVFDFTDKKTLFITDHSDSRIEHISQHPSQKIVVTFAKAKGAEPKPEKIDADSFIEVRNMKAKGNKLSPNKIKDIDMIDPFAKLSVEEIEAEEDGESPTEKLRKEKDKGKKGGPQGKLF